MGTFIFDVGRVGKEVIVASDSVLLFITPAAVAAVAGFFGAGEADEEDEQGEGDDGDGGVGLPGHD